MTKNKYEELMNWLQDDDFTKDSVHKLALELRVDIAYQLTEGVKQLTRIADYLEPEYVKACMDGFLDRGTPEWEVPDEQ